MTQGIVYVLTNPGMPGLVKIGRTVNIEQRLRTLYNSSVPFLFDLHHAVEVGNAEEVERTLLEVFGEQRVNSRREFLKVAPERVVAALKLTGGKPVGQDHVIGDGQEDVEDKPADTADGIADDDRKASETWTRRRANFTFRKLNIPVGSELTFSRDPSLTAIVANERSMVEFEGEKVSTGQAAETILRRDYAWGAGSRANGADFWEYKGEILNTLREKLEEESDSSEE